MPLDRPERSRLIEDEPCATRFDREFALLVAPGEAGVHSRKPNLATDQGERGRHATVEPGAAPDLKRRFPQPGAMFEQNWCAEFANFPRRQHDAR